VAVTENTVGALDAAADAGATGMETDFRLTSDRQIIVMHDATLDRTTNCSGPVDERTRKWILEHCHADDGQPIPFASDLLRAAHGRSMNLLAELKSDSQSGWDTAQMQTLANLITSSGMAGRVMVSATDAARLRRVESVASWLPTMWIRTTRPTVSQVNSNGVDNVSASAANLSPGLVAAMNAAGHLVYCRESNSQSDWEAYRADGVAGVVTDTVPEYLKWSRNTA
jgi:glycerophosphoryl diester phosphodiesterase